MKGEESLENRESSQSTAAGALDEEEDNERSRGEEGRILGEKDPRGTTQGKKDP
jgi:hypothetical protein